MRERMSASQACGSTPFILAVTIRLYMAAARCPPRSDPQNSHDLLPRAIPRSPRSAALLERHARPEQGEARPSLQDVVERFGQVMPTRELGNLLAHVGVKILDQRPAHFCQTARRSSAFLPLIDRSISNSASIRWTTSMAIGDSTISFLPAALRRAFSSISAIAKNGRRACAQQ